MHLKQIKKEQYIYIIVIVIGVIISSLYIYNDVVDTTSGGINFWNRIFSGDLLLFYYRKYTGLIYPFYICDGKYYYDFIMYIVFAIYDFPLWICEKITNIGFSELYITKLYARNIGLLFAIACSIVLYKISKLCIADNELAFNSSLGFLSAPLTFFSVFLIGCYDTIPIFFVLMGILSYMQNDKKRFLLFFALALPLKLFAFLFFIPLLLLNEKKLINIIKYLCISVTLIVIPKVIFGIYNVVSARNGSDDVGKHSSVILRDLFSGLYGLHETTFITCGTIPLFIVFFICMCVLCYFYKGTMDKVSIIYLLTAVIFSFVMLARVEPFWIIMLVPFTTLVTYINYDIFIENIIIEILFSIGYIINRCMFWPETSNTFLIENMTEHRFTDCHGLDTMCKNLYSMLGLGSGDKVIAALSGAICIAGFILFIMLNYPRNNKIKKYLSGNSSLGAAKYWVVLRLAVSCFTVMIPIWGVIEHIIICYLPRHLG